MELGNCELERKELIQELAEARSQLETERSDREKTEAELSELKQNPALAATLLEKLTPNATKILSQFRATRKKYYPHLAFDLRL
jgi:uncharacterized protein (DUF3084 family)